MIFARQKHNKRWNERPQLYRGRFFYLKRLVQTTLMICSVFVIASAVIYFKNSDMLRIRSVEVLGDLKQLHRDDVVVLSGLKDTDKLFTIRLSEIQKRIQKHPWVRQVRIRREFPDGLQIHVSEYAPKAILMADKSYLIDQHGKIFKTISKNDPQDLPIITGFATDELRKYPRLSRRSIDETIRFLNFVNDQRFYQQESISEINYDRVLGYTVYTRDTGVEIYYGRDDYEAKHRKLERFLLSPEYEHSAFIRLDLSANDRVIAKKL